MSLVAKYVDKRVLKVLDDLNLMSDCGFSIEFNEKYREIENKVMYLGDTEEIIRFYKLRRPRNYLYPLHLFYRRIEGNCPILHYPLGSIISKTMVNLIFSDDPVITISTGNERKDEEINELIEQMYNANEKGKLFQRACEMESYSGAVAFKPVIDKEFSDEVLLIPYAKEDIELVKKYDRITEVMFKDVYEVDHEKKYVLYTICGKGYIDYKLYQDKSNDNDRVKEVPLDTLEQTKDLKRLDFFNKDGTPYKHLICVYKENKANAASDYKNLYDDFAALDEIYSNMINFIRKSKIKTYLPENVLQVDANTGKKYIPNEYDTDNIILRDNNPEGADQKVERDVIELNESLLGYKEAFNNVLLNALATAGLSPASIGLDTAGANSSSLALNIRERVSMRTRSEKIKRWTEALQDLTELLLALQTMTVSGQSCYIEDFEGDINVEFAEYEAPTYDQKVQSIAIAMQNHLIDIDTALQMLYPDKSEEDLELMKFNIEGFLPDEDKIIDNELDQKDEDNDKKEEN